MKRYAELTLQQQVDAETKCLNRLLEMILEGSMRFNDKLNKERLQHRIDKAIAKADKMQTPWFAHEYLMDDVYIAERLKGMAVCDAEDAMYSEQGENVLAGVL